MSQSASTFNLNAAISGHAVGMITGTTSAPTTIDLVVNIRQEDFAIVGTLTSDKKTYRFLPDGSCTDGNSAHHIYLINDEIPITTGKGIITRGEGGSAVAINTLNPREEIATQIINSLLTHRSENIELMSEATIKNLASISYTIAQAMLNAATEYRSRDTDTTTPESSVDTSDLSDNTQKLLYDICDQLKKMRNESETPLQVKVTNASSFPSGGGGGTGSAFDGEVHINQPATDQPIRVSLEAGASIPVYKSSSLIGNAESIKLFHSAFNNSVMVNKDLHLKLLNAGAEQDGLLSAELYSNIINLITLCGSSADITAGGLTGDLQDHLDNIYNRLSALELKTKDL